MSDFDTSTDFRYSIARTGDRATMVASGEIDLASSPDLRRELHDLVDHGVRRITLDLGGVTFIDSSGLGALVGALKRMDEAGGGALEIRGCKPPVRKVFEITGLHQLFVFRD